MAASLAHVSARVIGATMCTACALGCSGSGDAAPLGAASGGAAGAAQSEGGSSPTGAESRGSDNAGSGNAGSNNGGSDAGTGTLADLLSRELYESMFPNRNALYGYDALIEAASRYPDFGAEGTLEQRRREVAGFLGNAAHETTGGWAAAPGGPESWGLYFTEEVGCEEGACTQYCDAANVDYPCQPGKTYHGRGPIQLSWNFNYGAFGTVLGLPLLSDPELVISDGVIAFSTALWFWMTPQAPKPSAHAALLGTWQPNEADTAAGRKPGFGMTVNIINGGLECGIPTDDRVRDRIRFYAHFAERLGTLRGENLECADMRSY
jgi:hypothetical protein